jgi:hypothetical protein
MAYQTAGYETPGGSVYDDPLPFAIDGVEFDEADTAEEGTYLNDAQFITTLEAPQTYLVVEHKIPGFKAITQAVEPEALKRVHAVVYTFTRDQREFMNSLDNYHPHNIQCELFEESPIVMYLEFKNPRKFRTGIQKFGIEWDLRFKEANDQQQ